MVASNRLVKLVSLVSLLDNLAIKVVLIIEALIAYLSILEHSHDKCFQSCHYFSDTISSVILHIIVHNRS